MGEGMRRERHRQSGPFRPRGRLPLLGLIFSSLVGIIVFRAFTFQVWKREPWKTMVMKQYQRRVRLFAQRGLIYDRGMHILAMDVPIHSLAVDPSQVRDRKRFAAVLAEVFSDEDTRILELLESHQDYGFVFYRRDITDQEKERLFESGLEGLIFVKERKRDRPHAHLGLQVLGITNADHTGVGGVEQAMDEVLRGGDGWAIFQKDGLNRSFSSLDYPVEPPKDGHHIVLTLNHVYQSIVEEELRISVDDHRAKCGMAVLMNPMTGEILAMASIIGRIAEDERHFLKTLQNQTVQIAFEPGSTFKIVTAAAALEEGLFNTNSLIHCENGAYQFSNHTINDHDKAYDWLTLSQILEVSSNIGAAKIGRKLGKKVLYQYARDFGFGNTTGIDLPGEAGGILRPIYRWSEYSTAAISFGQEISSTAVQLVSMVSVVANGGCLMKPLLYMGVLEDEGNTVRSFYPEVIRRVISEKTASELTQILEGVVVNGSGKEAGVQGIRIAGKTGTAQKSVPGYRGYLPGAVVSSFAGFWPVESPAFAMVVALDEPRDLQYGALSAAPTFSRIVSRIVGLPQDPRNESIRRKRPKRGFVFSSVQNEPAQGEGRDSRPEHFSVRHIPRVVGMSLREALKEMAARGVEVEVQGSGTVTGQNPNPGTDVEPGMVCKLICREWSLDGE